MLKNNSEMQYNMIKRFWHVLIILALISCQNQEQVSLSLEGIQNFDLIETLETSNKINKPVLLYFTGYACVNCKKMNDDLLKDTEIIKYLNEHFILIPLYVDDSTKAKKEEWEKSIFNKRMVRHVGKLNVRLQTILTRTGTQPIFAIVENEDSMHSYIGDTRDRVEFLDFLKKGSRD